MCASFSTDVSELRLASKKHASVVEEIDVIKKWNLASIQKCLGKLEGTTVALKKLGVLVIQISGPPPPREIQLIKQNTSKSLESAFAGLELGLEKVSDNCKSLCRVLLTANISLADLGRLRVQLKGAKVMISILSTCLIQLEEFSFKCAIPVNIKRKRYPDEIQSILQASYDIHQYPDAKERARLEELCGLNEVQVNNWFTNKRSRSRKARKPASPEVPQAKQKSPRSSPLMPSSDMADPISSANTELLLSLANRLVGEQESLPDAPIYHPPTMIMYPPPPPPSSETNRVLAMLISVKPPSSNCDKPEEYLVMRVDGLGLFGDQSRILDGFL